MRPVLPAIMLAAAVAGSPARGQDVLSGQRQVALCTLQYGSNARAPLAVSTIRTACNELVFEPGPLHDRDRQYDRCLLHYLQDAQSNAAAQQVIGSCRQLVPLF